MGVVPSGVCQALLWLLWLLWLLFPVSSVGKLGQARNARKRLTRPLPHQHSHPRLIPARLCQGGRCIPYSGP